MPFRYVPMVTKRRVIVFIALCWMYACVLSTLFIATNYSRDGWQGQCLAEMLYPLWLMLVLTSLHFFLPFAIMMYVHIAIFVVARRQQRAVSLSFKRNGVEPNGESKRAKLRAARLLAVPCGFFHVSWGPWFIAILWAVATNNTLRPHYVERFVQTLGILNSLGNPVLYAVTQPLLGRAMLAKLKTLFSMCKSKLQDHRNKQHHVESSTLVVPENVESTTV
ncbi:hypothetical protein BaRGS_00004724 [Batillaria attramentaria]|uniref:G-protein coupled receptors family 1 profile domain-containing protein n=1 Tax=Batillaria attramentaria TaxID=370345 RepID=A0ABD0LX97_9CAEN|nr:hypothetical protein BaRGS_023569 [Batillaria attramentaria]